MGQPHGKGRGEGPSTVPAEATPLPPAAGVLRAALVTHRRGRARLGGGRPRLGGLR